MATRREILSDYRIDEFHPIGPGLSFRYIIWQQRNRGQKNKTRQSDYRIRFLRADNSNNSYLAFWLQGGSIVTPTTTTITQPQSLTDNHAPNQPPTAIFLPPARFPFDEHQLRKAHNNQNRERNKAHRNQTIFEINDVEMENVENSSASAASTNGDRSPSISEKYMQPLTLAAAPFPFAFKQRPTTLNLSGSSLFLSNYSVCFRLTSALSQLTRE